MPPAASYLLDTNVLLALLRANSLGKTIDEQFALRSSLGRSLICVVTVGEMLSLTRKFNWGEAKRNALQELLNEVVWIDISHPEILEAYGDIDHTSTSQGRQMGKNDLWIAATAKVSKATLLTTDSDFDHLDPATLQRIWIDPNQ